MRIGVTGSNGRLGRVVVKAALERGWSAVGVDLPGTTPTERAHVDLVTAEADVRSYDALVKALDGCDALVHLAAHVSPRSQPPHVVHNDNVTGSYNALCAAVELGMDHVCLASSINAIGAAFSRRPRYDYFPLSEDHPSYNEDPYSLSKWAVEQQADSIARRHEGMSIATVRLHRLVAERADAVEGLDQDSEGIVRELWAYTTLRSSAEACLLALQAEWHGHERFYVVSPTTTHREPSRTLWQRHYPATPLRGDLEGHQGFYDCSKAERILGWRHED